MSDHEDDTMSGSLLVPLRAGELKKGGYIQIKGHPCKVQEMSTSKTGKHGHAKMNIVGIDVLTGKKYEEMTPTSHNVDVPKVKRTEWQALAVDESGYISLMDADGNTKDDVKTEGDYLEKIKSALDAGDKDVLVAVLSAPEGDTPENCNLVEIVVDVRLVGEAK
jgi:translation initiation factor 5A